MLFKREKHRVGGYNSMRPYQNCGVSTKLAMIAKLTKTGEYAVAVRFIIGPFHEIYRGPSKPRWFNIDVFTAIMLILTPVYLLLTLIALALVLTGGILYWAGQLLFAVSYFITFDLKSAKDEIRSIG